MYIYILYILIYIYIIYIHIYIYYIILYVYIYIYIIYIHIYLYIHICNFKTSSEASTIYSQIYILTDPMICLPRFHLRLGLHSCVVPDICGRLQLSVVSSQVQSSNSQAVSSAVPGVGPTCLRYPRM